MSLLFVHDHIFKKNGDRIYSNGGLADEVLTRYTDIFGEVTVAARMRTTGEVGGLSEITNRKVSITDAYGDVKKLSGLVEKADHIIVRLPSVLGLKAASLARKHKKPYAVELVGCPWDSYRYHSIKGKAIAPIMWFLTGREVKKAGYVLYVTEKFLQKRYGTCGKQIACSDAFLSLEGTEERKNNKEIVLGTVGSVNLKYKGQQYVIKAMSELIKDGYKLRYRLAGGGDNTYLKKTAEKYGVSQNVEFVGSLPHNEIFGFMDSIDIYIQPSNADAIPRAVLEAMSRGCPVIGSTTGGIPELIPGECVFKRKNTADLTKALRRAIDKKCEGLSAESIKRIADFDPEKLNDKRNRFYRSFIKDTEVK